MAEARTIRIKRITDLETKFSKTSEGRAFFVEENKSFYKDIFSSRLAVGQFYYAPYGIIGQAQDPDNLLLTNALVVEKKEKEEGVVYDLVLFDDKGNPKTIMDGGEGFSGDYNDLTNKPDIPEGPSYLGTGFLKNTNGSDNGWVYSQTIGSEYIELESLSFIDERNGSFYYDGSISGEVKAGEEITFKQSGHGETNILILDVSEDIKDMLDALDLDVSKVI